MRLNTIKSAAGSRKRGIRVGRGIGSGLGKTCGSGHKGQKSRSGGKPAVGFEGGQMPLYRRLPKRGFVSLKNRDRCTVSLLRLFSFSGEIIDLDFLKNNGVTPKFCRSVKVVAASGLEVSLHLKGISVSEKARAYIEAQNGRIE